MLRILKNIPQKTVAKKMGVSQPAVSKIEHAETNSGTTRNKYLRAINWCNEDVERLKEALPRPQINKMAVLKRML
ncbi:MAG: helix-turn-helix domain-containing protein [Bacteroidetes bacterium]|nr:helix-turn-helix domain-containing protein [Bacteroidota bacterium]MBS1931694.1 helix-turn-helix domain-containing protein [Bacteroidota bacterium]